MFLTAHVAIGALIGQQVQSPLTAFILGYFSHWLIDAIPHGDENLLPSNLDTRKRKKLLYTIASIDLVGVLLIFILLNKLSSFNTAMFFGFLGAATPDLLWGASEILPFKSPWSFLDKLHNYFHKLTGIIVSFRIGIIIQLTTLVLTLLAIVR